MPLAVKKKQERTIARCGNSAVLYLPKEYFMPGEKVVVDMKIDFDGNIELTLRKRLFNFNSEEIKAALKNDFKMQCEAFPDGTQGFTAEKGALTVNCICAMQELEPTYVNVSRLFNSVNSAETYLALTAFVGKLAKKYLDVYIEPEGDIDAVNVFKDPKKNHLDDELQAVEFLQKSGKKLDYLVIMRFNSRRHTVDDVLAVLSQLSQSDEALLEK